MLAVLTPERLEHALFPLGDTLKADVRARGRRARAAAGRQARLATTSASSPTGTRGAGWGRGSAPRPGTILDADGDGRRRARRGLRLHRRAAARAAARPARARRQAALRPRRCGPADDAVVVGPPRRWRRPGRGRRRRSGADRRPARGRRRRPGPRARRGGARASWRRRRAPSSALGSTVPVRGRRRPGRPLVLYDGTRVVGSATIDGRTSRAAAAGYRPMSCRRARTCARPASGIGSWPGTDVARDPPDHRSGSCPNPCPLPARAAGARTRRGHDRAGRRPARRPAGRPPAGRLAAGRPPRPRPRRAQAWLRAGPGRPRRGGGRLRRAAEGPVHRAVDAGRGRLPAPGWSVRWWTPVRAGTSRRRWPRA